MEIQQNENKVSWSRKVVHILLGLFIVLIIFAIALNLISYALIGTKDHSWQSIRPAKLSWSYSGVDKYDVSDWSDVTLDYEVPTFEGKDQSEMMTCDVPWVELEPATFPTAQALKNEQLYLYAEFYMDYLFEGLHCTFKFIKGEQFISRASDFEKLRKDSNFQISWTLAKYNMKKYKSENSFWSYLLSFEGVRGWRW